MPDASDPYYIKWVAQLSGLPTGQPSPVVIMAGVVNLVLGVVGVLAILVILYGGYLWLTSLGNEEKITKAKRTLLNGVIGLAIIFSSYVVAQFIVLSISGVTGA